MTFQQLQLPKTTVASSIEIIQVKYLSALAILFILLDSGNILAVQGVGDSNLEL